MIVVTAPTGQIGRQVLQNLLSASVPVRVVARDPSRLPDVTRERVEVVQGSLDDRDVVTKAFSGADAVFWLLPPNGAAESVQSAFVDFSRPACAALSDQGVKRVVGISALGRGTPTAGRAGYVTGSLAMDDLIAGTGVSYRALANPSFMDNLARQATLIKAQGIFTSPISGNRKAPSVATRDIASVATRLLLDAGWHGVDTVPVLGPEDLSLEDMAQILTDVLERPVLFQQISGEAYKDRFLSFGMSEAMAQGMLDMALAKDAGLDNGVVRTPQNSTPTKFRHWTQEVMKPLVLA